MCSISERLMVCNDPEFCPGIPESRKVLAARVAELKAAGDALCEWADAILYDGDAEGVEEIQRWCKLTSTEEG